MVDARFTISAESAEALANLDKVAREFRRIASAGRGAGRDINVGFSAARRGIESIRTGLERTKLQFIGLFALSGARRAASSLIELGEQLGKLSEQTGLSIERLNALRFAADQADTDFNALAKAFAKLSVLGAESGEAASKAGKVLAGLGITTRDPNERLLQLADRFSRVADEGDRTALAVAILGQRIGPELVPLLSQGAEGLRRVMERGQQLAGGLNAEGVRALREFGDELDAFKLAGQGLAAELARNLTPALGQLTARLRDAFADPETRAGIATTADLLGRLITVLVENAETVLRVTGAIAGLRAGAAIGSLAGPIGTAVGGWSGPSAAASCRSSWAWMIRAASCWAPRCSRCAICMPRTWIRSGS